MKVTQFINMELEQIMLCHQLYNPMPLDLSEVDFAYQEHWEIYNMLQDGKEFVDFLSTKYSDYMTAIRDCSIPADVSTQEQNALALKELSRKRKLFVAAEHAMEKLESETSTDIVSFLRNTIDDNSPDEGIKTNKQVRETILKNLEMPPDNYSTGIKCLDEAMGGGLYQGFTYGFAGAEKSGKTTLAHTISFNLDCPHVYFAMEMGSMQIEQRNISRQLKFNPLKFLHSASNLRNTVHTAQPKDNIYYCDAIGYTVEKITQAALMAKIKHGIKGFIVDYWQLIQGKSHTEEAHLRHVAQHIANFARKNGLWCILLAQMNTEGKLFGGNGLRKACDQLYMIHHCESPETGRWLQMDASRYTLKTDIGNEDCPEIYLETREGLYFREW